MPVLVGKAIPDYNMCDLVVYRQAPVVARTDGMVMNNFSGMGHYIELIPAAQFLNETQEFGGGTTANASTTNGTTQPLQTQLITMPWSHLESSLCLIQKSFLRMKY